MESEGSTTLDRVIRKASWRKWQLNRGFSQVRVWAQCTWRKIRCKCTEGKCATTRKSLWLEPIEEEENEKRVWDLNLDRLYRVLKVIGTVVMCDNQPVGCFEQGRGIIWFVLQMNLSWSSVKNRFLGGQVWEQGDQLGNNYVNSSRKWRWCGVMDRMFLYPHNSSGETLPPNPPLWW